MLLTFYDLMDSLTSGDFNQVQLDRFLQECLIMSRFKHSHVMSLMGACLDTGSAPYIIMPYMANGSLLKYIKRERNNIVFYTESDEDEVKHKQYCTFMV